MKQSQVFVFTVLVVFALLAGVWEGIVLNMMNIHAACGTKGYVKYESWVLVKPIEIDCKLHENNK